MTTNANATPARAGFSPEDVTFVEVLKEIGSADSLRAAGLIEAMKADNTRLGGVVVVLTLLYANTSKALDAITKVNEEAFKRAEALGPMLDKALAGEWAAN